MKIYDTIIIGGGQAGLSVGYFMRRTNLAYRILDDQDTPGGAWLKTWDNLSLFSPTQYSSLSGWLMPPSEGEYPTKYEFLDYLRKYEKRYNFPIRRNTKVTDVVKADRLFEIKTETGSLYAKTVVSATGTANNPVLPAYSGMEKFKGQQLHSRDYKNPEQFKDKTVAVVGEGNSGAQILAELARVAKTEWICLEKPTFLPEDIDGRYLFHQANAKFYGKQTKKEREKLSLSNIVQVPAVKKALQNGVYENYRLFEEFQEFYENGIIWEDGKKEKLDAVIWCTGFKADLKHLRPLNIFDRNRIKTRYTHSVKEPGLWLVGYGSWTGYASATIYGVGKTARQTVKELKEFLHA